jgi:hypothetical protein
MYVYDILIHVVLYYIYVIYVRTYTIRYTFTNPGPAARLQVHPPSHIQLRTATRFAATSNDSGVALFGIRWVYRIIPLRTKLLDLLGGQQTIYCTFTQFGLT